MSYAIDDQLICDIIVQEIEDYYPHLSNEAYSIANELGPYLVESMWSVFDSTLAEELNNKGK